MDVPLISIITVTYNCREQLLSTLASVREQDFGGAEHIVVDGASTDGTAGLIREHAGRLAAWLSEPDGGIYDAMNKGLRLARGRYVLFLNAGDTFYRPDTLKKIFAQQAKASPADIYYGQTKITDLSGRITGDRRLRAPEDLNWKSFRHGMLVCHQSFIVRRSLAPSYDLTYSICSDIDWCIRCMKEARDIRYTGRYISCFLEGGVSRQRVRKALKERFSIMNKHYGLAVALSSHLYIGLRYLRQRLSPGQRFGSAPDTL